MSKLYHLPAAGKHKVFLAVPAYDGVGAGAAWSLAHAQQKLLEAGRGSEVAILGGDCHVDDARNMLIWKFLSTDCEDLVFLDTDLKWDPDDLVKLCKYDRQVVGATYQKRQLSTEYPVRFLERKELWAEHDGLIEVAGLPAGFLRIRRDAMEKMAAASAQYKVKDEDVAHEVFRRDTHDLTRFSGDYEFCRRWREMGGQCYLAPEPLMEHGELFIGSWGHQRRKEMLGIVGACVQEIRHGYDVSLTYDDLFDAWGNDFAALSDTLAILVRIARERGGPILEIGSGVSTVALASTGLEIDVLEHDQVWAMQCAAHLKKHGLDGNVRFFEGPLLDGWYSSIPDRVEYKLAFVDGPPRAMSDRRRFLDSGLRADVYVLDDADDPKVTEMAHALGTPSFIGKRPCAVVASHSRVEAGIEASLPVDRLENTTVLGVTA